MVGNQAVIGGTTLGVGGVPAGHPWNVYVMDNGPPGGPVPDLISPFTFYDPGFDSCADVVPPVGYLAVTSGDIVVRSGMVSGV